MINVKKVNTKLTTLVFAAFVILVSSCSNEDDPMPAPVKTGDEAIAVFRSCFYKQGGDVNAIKLDNFLETEWAIPMYEADQACELFTRITGMDASLSNTYTFSYTSTDKKCTIRLEGKEKPSEAVYATMYIDIPECPEIRKVILATPKYFEGTNSAGYVDIL